MNTDFARQQMIDQQVRAWSVLDVNVLAALKAVPREQFVPEVFGTLAFADTEIPLGHGQRMMTPTVEGRLLQALSLAPGDKVLEIGTGSGFVTAVLATLSAEVTSIDIYDDFLDTAKRRLEDCGIENVELTHMDGTKSLPDQTYDAIAVTGSMQFLDQRLKNALNPGGRLFVVLGVAPAMTATRVTRIDANDWRSDTLFETDLPPLVNGALPPQFSF
ncbi:MAG: protein-L-isoaspartate O-methyltransferase [Gammaproteobacteria bacterium]|nr:protein-L-isoaspartate O-methyltransferase [Gammaproteobacteria bacterium]